MKTSAADLGRTIPSFDAAGFMNLNTVISGHLCVGSALPDPPFEFMDGDNARGFDVELMQAIAAELGLTWRLVSYTGGDFNGIFEGLTSGTFDCIASGTTITPERERKAAFCAPYICSGQSLVCNVEATPHVRSIDDLYGMISVMKKFDQRSPAIPKSIKALSRVTHSGPMQLSSALVQAGGLGSCFAGLPRPTAPLERARR